MIKEDSTAMIPSFPPYVLVPLRRPHHYSSGREATEVCQLSSLQAAFREHSCSRRYQNTVNPSRTEVPKDTLKTFHSDACKRSQCTKRVLHPCAMADSKALCKPNLEPVGQRGSWGSCLQAHSKPLALDVDTAALWPALALAFRLC